MKEGVDMFLTETEIHEYYGNYPNLYVTWKLFNYI